MNNPALSRITKTVAKKRRKKSRKNPQGPSTLPRELELKMIEAFLANRRAKRKYRAKQRRGKRP